MSFITISSVLNKLEPILIDIELNSSQIDQHNSNANIANTGAFLTYLFTSNSKNSTVKTIGQIASIGGLIYGSSQKKLAAGFQGKNIILISQILHSVEQEGINYIRQESQIDNIRRFIELNLKIGKHLDVIVASHLSKIKSKGHLSKKNIRTLLQITNINVFNHKIRLNKIYAFLDSSKQIPNIEQEFISDVNLLNAEKIIKEGLITRIIIITLIVIGIILTKYSENSIWIVLSGLFFWGINHYFPLFPETKKFKRAIDAFILKTKSTCGINSINYR